MRQKLFTVDDHFNITGRGTVITGKLEKNVPSYKIGNPIILVRPDGREIMTKIDGIEMLNPPNFESMGVLVRELTKNDVPIGTIVFLNADQ